MYKLYGVISHSGTLSGGHYYADVQRLESNEWFSCSDSNIKSISAEDKSKDAYLLFYVQEPPDTEVD